MSDDDTPKYFSFEERQRQKARLRARDLERLARGEISATELQRESLQFRNLRRDRIALTRDKKTGEIVWLAQEPKPVSKEEDEE